MAAPVPRLKQKFDTEILPAVMQEFGITNKFAAPSLTKISVNMGVGQAHENKKLMETVAGHMALITGQKPIITKARRSVAGFKLREGWAVGCKVTLRRQRMWYFLDKVISLAVPRIRDFRGLKTNAFDKAGNYSLGLTEQGLFPEINIDKLDPSETQGMDITLVFQNSNAEKSRFILTQIGMPFVRPEDASRM